MNYMFLLILVVYFFVFFLFMYRASKKEQKSKNIQTHKKILFVNSIVNEINTAISLGKNKIIHNFHILEPRLDSKMVQEIAREVLRTTTCILSFDIEDDNNITIKITKVELN